MKRITVFLLILILLSAVFESSAIASSDKNLGDLQKDKKAITGEIKDTQNLLNDTKAEIAKVEAEIAELDGRLSVAEDELETINRTLKDTESTQKQTEKELEQARDERDNQFDVFKTRLRVMHEQGQGTLLDVLLKATDWRDFLARFEYLNIVAKYDQQMVERLTEAEDRVASKAEEIARQKNTIESLKYMQTVKMEALETALKEREAYFKQLDADEQRYQSMLTQQMEEEKAIQAAIRKKEEEEARKRAAQQAAQAAVPYNGSMLWPAPGYKTISDTYRQRVNPVNKKSEFHSGVDIASASGNNIVAADSGEVILAQYYGSYGNCVIISHGGGVSTLYAHASKLLVSVGQRVTKGDVIAKIGSTGRSTGPHLHFEVRINGNHTNPKPYLGY